MNDNRKDITITIINDGKEYVIKTYKNEFRNLMVLLNNSIYLENFGECGGMGRCATCLIEVAGLKSNANVLERNEMATIAKTRFAGANFRLACQILITEDLDKTVIDISAEG